MALRVLSPVSARCFTNPNSPGIVALSQTCYQPRRLSVASTVLHLTARARAKREWKRLEEWGSLFRCVSISTVQR